LFDEGSGARLNDRIDFDLATRWAFGSHLDQHNHVFGYETLLVCDGGAMPANPGVNPSLTITARRSCSPAPTT
jgi:hypothetical protein